MSAAHTRARAHTRHSQTLRRRLCGRLRSWLTGGPSPGAGTDNATVRYYVDGEESASIEFKPPMATGSGYDDLTVWGTAKAGHGATDGAWFINYRIPFQQVCACKCV